MSDEAISDYGKRLLQVWFRYVASRLLKHHPRNDITLFLLSSFFIASCSTGTPQATPQVVSVYSTFAVELWLTELYACADSSAVIVRVEDANSADIVLQIGEPEFLATPAYQIDEEEVLIVAHRQSPIQNLNLPGAQALFMGLGDPSVQVWVYASEEDIQKVFNQFVMEGRIVSSSGLVAANPQQMSDVLVNEASAVGILPRHWMVDDVREVFSAGVVPVLVITQNEPQGVIKELIACLQK